MSTGTFVRNASIDLLRRLLSASPSRKGVNFVASRLRRVLVDPDGTPALAVRRTRLGRRPPGFLVDLDLRDRMQYMMYLRGSHEPETEALILELLPVGGCFIDVGANIGYFSLLVACADRACRVVAFEPWLSNIERLRANVALNDVTNVEIVARAVSDRTGVARMTSPDPVRESGWARLGPATVRGGPQDIDVVDIDAELDRLGAPSIDVLKIDIEGGETRALRGAHRTLTRPGRRHVIVEINDACLANEGSSRAELDAHLRECGYRFVKAIDHLNAHYAKEK